MTMLTTLNGVCSTECTMDGRRWRRSEMPEQIRARENKSTRQGKLGGAYAGTSMTTENSRDDDAIKKTNLSEVRPFSRFAKKRWYHKLTM